MKMLNIILVELDSGPVVDIRAIKGLGQPYEIGSGWEVDISIGQAGYPLIFGDKETIFQKRQEFLDLWLNHC